MQKPESTDDAADQNPLRQLSPGTVRILAQAIAEALESDVSYKQLPIPLRALVAAALLTATDQPVNQSSLASVGRYSRSTAHRKGGWTAELDAFITHGPERFKSLLDGPKATQSSVTELRGALDEANAKLAEERQRRKDAESQLEPLVAYARDLSRELRNYREEERATLRSKLVSLPTPSVTDDGDSDSVDGQDDEF